MKARRFFTVRYRNCVSGLVGILVGLLFFSTYRVPYEDMERFARCQNPWHALHTQTKCPYPSNGPASILFYTQLTWIGVFLLLALLLTIFTTVPKHAWAIVWSEHVAKFSFNTAITCLLHLLFSFPFIAVVPSNPEAFDSLRTFVAYAYFIWYVYALGYALLLLISMCVLDYLESDQIAANNRAVVREDAITAYQQIFTDAPPPAPFSETIEGYQQRQYQRRLQRREGMEHVQQIHIRVAGENDFRQVPDSFETKNFLNKSYKMRYIGLVLTTSFFVYGISIGMGYSTIAPECMKDVTTDTSGEAFRCVPVASFIYGAVYGLVWSGLFYLTVFSTAIPKVGLYGKRALVVD